MINLFLVLSIGLAAAHAATEPISLADPVMKLRDPFKRPVAVEEKTVPLGELERFPVEELRMVGMMTGPDRKRALVRAPDGKTHFVAERMKIGVHKGVITKITSRSITVRERIVNILGQEEPIESEIRMAPKSVEASNDQGGSNASK